MIYLQLLWSFFQIGALSFGGGYAAMPLIQNQVVTLHGWLSMAEFQDLITLSQMTPGPIAIDAAPYVGWKLAGMGGAVVATVGCVLPSCLIMTALIRLYYKYRKLDAIQTVLNILRPAVIALIAAAGVTIIVSVFWPQALTLAATHWPSVILFAICLALMLKTKIDPILAMALAGVANVALHLLGI